MATAAGATSRTARIASGGTYATGKASASQRQTAPGDDPERDADHEARPASSVDCQAIATRHWRGVKPIVRSTERSCLRRRTVVTSAWATVAQAMSPKNTPSEKGSERNRPRSATAEGRTVGAAS